MDIGIPGIRRYGRATQTSLAMTENRIIKEILIVHVKFHCYNNYVYAKTTTPN